MADATGAGCLDCSGEVFVAVERGHFVGRRVCYRSNFWRAMSEREALRRDYQLHLT